VNLFDVSGRVVIVTGGGRGIGRAYSEAFAQAGMRVVLADIFAQEAERTAAAIRAVGGAALAVRTDISREDDAQAMAEAAAREFGGIDALVNNASLMSSLPRRPRYRWRSGTASWRSTCAACSCAAARSTRTCSAAARERS
jgi:NAD(P)-dependent dehydrogenase (short-subunit alcohol dehydrogenase family)